MCFNSADGRIDGPLYALMPLSDLLGSRHHVGDGGKSPLRQLRSLATARAISVDSVVRSVFLHDDLEAGRQLFYLVGGQIAQARFGLGAVQVDEPPER